MSWWVFEGIIWFFLVVVGAALVEIITKNGRKIFKQRTQFVAVVVLFFSWSVIFYGSFIEPKILVVKNETVQVENLDLSLRAALLSDFHVGPYKGAGWVEEVVKKTNEQKPEIVFLLGDYVFGHLGKVSDLAAFVDLKAPLGVYAILGNHDYDNDREAEIEAALENLNIKVLRNESVPINLSDGSRFWLAGVSDLWNDADLQKTLASRTESEKVILLSHNPDAVLSSDVTVADLILSGHTHGGQINLPWLGSVAFVPTKLGKDFSAGWFEINNEKIFITPGLGETGPRARLFNPPEIVVLTVE